MNIIRLVSRAVAGLLAERAPQGTEGVRELLISASNFEGPRNGLARV